MGQIGDLSPEGSVALGIIVGLVSTSVQSVGLTLQRKSHILEDEKDATEYRRPPYRRRRWQLGMGMFIISNIAGSTIQITTLPLPVLSTLQASGLVFNSICASLILGEPFTRWSLGGTLLVCIGAILIAIFGAIPEPAHNLDQLLALLGRKQFILWIVGTAIVVLATIAGGKFAKRLSVNANANQRMRLWRGMAYGAVSGILSAHSLLVAKSAVELLVRTILDHHNQFNRWQSWAILLTLLALALSQLYCMHRGLRLCSTSILYPFVFCVYNIIAILDGLIYFHETSRLSLSHALLIALGTVILLAGVLALSWRLNDDPATRPPVAQNPLTPGLGFVDDADDDESRSDTETATVSDEETGKETPSSHPDLSPSPLPRNRSLTSKSTNFLLPLPRSRTKGMAEDIWQELDDEGEPSSGNVSPYQSRADQRRASSFNMPAGKISHDTRRSTSARFSPDIQETRKVSESTPLLTRAETGRSYRDIGGRRRASGLTPKREHWDRRRRRSAGSATGGTGSAGGSQDALGGWWKMKWWKERRGRQGNGKGKERKDGHDDDGEDEHDGGGR